MIPRRPGRVRRELQLYLDRRLALGGLRAVQKTLESEAGGNGVKLVG